MQSSSNNKDETVWWQPSLILFVRLSGWIGGPIIIALFLGKWLDQKYDSGPWLFIGMVGAAFIISSIGIVKEATEAMKKIDEEGKKQKEDKKD